MVKIAICDDNQIMVTHIEEIVNNYLLNVFIDHSIEQFYDGITLKKAYNQGERFDIIFLDIEMCHLNGIEVAKKIRKIDRNVIIIFVSNFETYFLQLFEVEPFRFIKKSASRDEFCKILQLAYERVIENDAYYQYKYNKTFIKVFLREILYFESSGRIINIHTVDRIHKYYGKLDKVEERLENNNLPFLRIHKSFYVNFYFIEKITYTKVQLSDGSLLQISKNRQQEIRKKYMEVLEGR